MSSVSDGERSDRVRIASKELPTAASPSAVVALPATVEDVGPAVERSFVHDVYEAIAPHFSQTRYKSWPIVERFLNSRSCGEFGADIGCGNGKYMAVNPGLFCIGSDRSFSLTQICAARGYEVAVADTLHLPYRSAVFDFVISIAVIHHLTTPERRKDSIKELLRILRPGGELIIFVWAIEQNSRRNFDPNSQDVLVPWTLSAQHRIPADFGPVNPLSLAGAASGSSCNPHVFRRYYHLFREGELSELVEHAVKEVPGMFALVSKVGYDKDNWYVIVRRQLA